MQQCFQDAGIRECCRRIGEVMEMPELGQLPQSGVESSARKLLVVCCGKNQRLKTPRYRDGLARGDGIIDALQFARGPRIPVLVDFAEQRFEPSERFPIFLCRHRVKGCRHVGTECQELVVVVAGDAGRSRGPLEELEVGPVEVLSSL